MQQIIFEDERKLDLRTLSKPVIGEDQFLLRTLITGISAGTEGMWWNATATALKSGRKNYPYAPGYELIGEVIEVGSKVRNVDLGDRVFAMKPHASFAVVGRQDVWFKLPGSVSNETALSIALTGTSLHAIHQSGITIGDSCAVVGLGVLGLNLIQILSKSMACEVLAVTGTAEKQRLARELGAKSTLSRDETPSLSKDQLVYASFDCSGVSGGLHAALNTVRDQGVVVGAGFYTEPMKFDGEIVFAREVTIRGVRATGVNDKGNVFNRWNRDETMRLAHKLVSTGVIENDALVTHRFAVSDACEAYEMIADKKRPYLQVVLNWS